MDDVPSGTYRIKMWHEGVRLKRIIESLQRYAYEDPYESTQQVVVTPGGEAVINFDLALRSSGSESNWQVGYQQVSVLSRQCSVRLRLETTDN